MIKKLDQTFLQIKNPDCLLLHCLETIYLKEVHNNKI